MMRSLIIGTIVLVIGSFALIACEAGGVSVQREGWNHYGLNERARGEEVALGEIDGGERGVIVEGEIVDVCQTKGCWMRLRDGDDELFVRFKDYSFFVPMNAAGHHVRIHGDAIASVMSVDELRHYAEDAGKSEEEIAAITKPETRITFYADDVYIEGEGLSEPHRQ